mmetsp:Transcript_22248/g.48546  ORF Transcript_22248/g.48546 Transcript_22248/m.48546 type:complete len:238 (+) Transcript_22248:106-819(+)
MPFCDLSPTQVVWNRTNSRSAVPGTNVPVFQIQMIGPREVQDNFSMSDSLHDKYRAITKISTHDAIAAAKARQDRVQKALALVSATPQVSQQRPMLGQERLRAQQTEQHVFSGSSKVTSYSDVQIVRKSLLTKPFSQAASIFIFCRASCRPRAARLFGAAPSLDVGLRLPDLSWSPPVPSTLCFATAHAELRARCQPRSRSRRTVQAPALSNGMTSTHRSTSRLRRLEPASTRWSCT